MARNSAMNSRNHPHNYPKLHNAAWPGVVGKGPGAEPPIDLDHDARPHGRRRVRRRPLRRLRPLPLRPAHRHRFQRRRQIRQLADKARRANLEIGTVVAPVWGRTGGGSAMGSADDQAKFLGQVRKGCRIAERLRRAGHPAQRRGADRLGLAAWRPGTKTRWATRSGSPRPSARPARSPRTTASGWPRKAKSAGAACTVGSGCCNCWRWSTAPQTLGFQADMAHTLLYLLGYNAPEDAILPPDFNWRDREQLRGGLSPVDRGPAALDDRFPRRPERRHRARHRHARQDRPPLPARRSQGKLDIPHHAGYWLRDEKGELTKRIRHICWDGCMFPNDVMTNPQTWNDILARHDRRAGRARWKEELRTLPLAKSEI